VLHPHGEPPLDPIRAFEKGFAAIADAKAKVGAMRPDDRTSIQTAYDAIKRAGHTVDAAFKALERR
jgi:hypothetical protein